MGGRATVDCIGFGGRVVAKLEIEAAEKGELSQEERERLLRTIPEEEAARNGESPVQLRENASYHCRIENNSGESRKLALENNPLFERYRFRDRGEYLIRTRGSAGTLTFRVVDEAGEFVGRGLAEIRSIKLNYREEFRGMVCGIAAQARELLYQLGAATEIAFISNWSQNPPTLQQQVEFLREILYGGRFWTALDQILRIPHEKLVSEPETRSVSGIGRADSSIARQLASKTPRTAIPKTHPLSKKMATVPRHIEVGSRMRTTDTIENQFVKHALKDFTAFLHHAEEVIKREDKQKYEPVVRDCMRLRSELSRRLSAGLFRSVSDPKILPLGSPVLQRKAGYREVFQAWLGFRASALLKWEGAEDVFGGGGSAYSAGKKDLPSLYEAWLFFQLLEVFRAKFKVPDQDVRSFFKPQDGLGNFTLKKGTILKFDGHEAHGLKLQGRFQYNRSFSASLDPRDAGSWTRVLRPDYTMTFWPAGTSLWEAEANETAVHIHFDAKYRVHDINALFGKVDGDLNEEELAEEEKSENDGNYNRADLLKMHAYRDAIRRSEGAYVLYPGKITDTKKDNRHWQGYHELLPGLGAFAVRPTSTGEAEGMQHVAEFLGEAIALLANRASRLAHGRYGDRRANEGSEIQVEEPLAIKSVNRVIEGILPQDRATLQPGQETIVLAGAVRDEDQLAWVNRKGLYNFRFDKTRTGYLPKAIPDYARAQLMVLFKVSGDPIAGLYRIHDDFFEVNRDELVTLHEYPRTPSADRYLVFPVQKIGEPAECEWDKDRMLQLHEKLGHRRWSGKPFQLTLSQLMTAKVLPGAGT